ncbi:MAG: protein kinase [Polyangiaceae bacterium]
MWSNPEPGTVFAGRYKLLSPLARGGMGSVWRAEHVALDCEVAIKLIDPRIAALEMGVPRFLREARALASLHSPHIVRVSDFGSEGEIVYLVMELLEGRTLGQRLVAEGKLSALETLRVVTEICKAMSHAHARGIVHRDLKPDNVFLCDQSRDHLTKVLDFGIAKPLGLGGRSTATTDVGSFLGTPSYMSPEQCREAKDVDQRSDLWAIGAITYECLVGKRRFDGEGLGDLVVRICTEDPPPIAQELGLPQGFDAWLRKAMARDPARRFQSAEALGQALRHALGQGSVADPALADTQIEGRLDQLPVSENVPLGTLDRGIASQVAPRDTARYARGSTKLLLAGGVALLVLVAAAVLQRRAAAPGPGAMADTRSLAPSEPNEPTSPPAGVVVGAAPVTGAKESNRASAGGALAVDAGALPGVVPPLPVKAARPAVSKAPAKPPKASSTRPRADNPTRVEGDSEQEREALRRKR